MQKIISLVAPMSLILFGYAIGAFIYIFIQIRRQKRIEILSQFIDKIRSQPSSIVLLLISGISSIIFINLIDDPVSIRILIFCFSLGLIAMIIPVFFNRK